MSDVLVDLKTLIYDSSLLSDFAAHSYFGINDEDDAFRQADKWTAFKREGGGQVTKEFGTPNIRLWLGGENSNKKALYDTAQLLVDYINQTNNKQGSIFHVVIQSDVIGPLSLSAGRVYFELNLQVFQNRS